MVGGEKDEEIELKAPMVDRFYSILHDVHNVCARIGQHNTAQHNTAQHNTTQHNTAQHSTAQHSTAQHSTAQHSTAQHSTGGTLVALFLPPMSFSALYVLSYGASSSSSSSSSLFFFVTEVKENAGSNRRGQLSGNEQKRVMEMGRICNF